MPALAMSSGDQIQLYIHHTGGYTTYQITNNNGYRTSGDVQPDLSSWSQNSFQTMTEGTCDGCSFGASAFTTSEFYDSGGTVHYITSSGGANTAPSQYGSVCSSGAYSLGSWGSSGLYGYSQSSSSTRGYCGSNVYGTGHTSGGTVSNPNNILGGPDSLYANLHAANLNDWAYVQVDWGSGSSVGSSSGFTGTLSLYAYTYNNGQGAYDSHVQVSTSKDGTTWTKVYDQYWSPGSNSPSWISAGSVSGIRYVQIKVLDDAGTSANIYVDAVNIG